MRGVVSPIGSQRTLGNGYVMVKVGRDHPYSNGHGWQYEHRLVIMDRLGRPLLPSEHVHHANGDKADNRPENLVLVSPLVHSAQHALPVQTRRTNDRGYVTVKLGRGHPFANRVGWQYEHRLRMMEHLDRPLRPGEQVRHRSKNKTDNRIENLYVVSDDPHCLLCAAPA